MNLDDPVCLCFRVSRRKLLNFLRIYEPKVASQLSQCGSAGTGCGWCIPYLQKMFEESRREGESDLETLSHEDYRRGRQAHIAEGKGTPPPPG